MGGPAMRRSTSMKRNRSAPAIRCCACRMCSAPRTSVGRSGTPSKRTSGKPSRRSRSSLLRDDEAGEPLRIGEQRIARTVMRDAAAVEDQRVVRDAERYLGVLLDENQRQGIFSDQSIERFEEGFNDDWGEAFERLVHQHERGVTHQRAADGEHLLLAAGDLVSLVGAPLGQAREEVVDALERPATRTGGDAEIFLYAERRKDLALLRHEADAEARALIDRQAGNGFLGEENFPRVESGVAHDSREQRGLADAVAS